MLKRRIEKLERAARRQCGIRHIFVVREDEGEQVPSDMDSHDLVVVVKRGEEREIPAADDGVLTIRHEIAANWRR